MPRTLENSKPFGKTIKNRVKQLCDQNRISRGSDYLKISQAHSVISDFYHQDDDRENLKKSENR